MSSPSTRTVVNIVSRCWRLWSELACAQLFITGGTGFYGSWLVESLVAANDKLSLGASAVVLNRNPESFLRKCPHLRGRDDLTFIAGDVRKFDFPKGKFTHVIHAATEASAKLNREDPLLMIDTIVEGTRRTLEFAVHCGARQFLNTSSGAVYGDIPASIGPVPESFMGGPDVSNPKWAYGEGKRLSELLCAIYADKHGLETKNVRCFATIGPGLPLDTHFAIGNFIADALAGREIIIEGDGSAVRSYIDIADLTVWLWHVLVFGESKQAYTVGSEEGYSIREIAEKVRDVLAPGLGIKVLGQPLPHQYATHYVPSTAKARETLGVSLEMKLDDSIRATAEWAKTLAE
jgi:nucleoside-diphosphate-sugar epimerase